MRRTDDCAGIARCHEQTDLGAGRRRVRVVAIAVQTSIVAVVRGLVVVVFVVGGCHLGSSVGLRGWTRDRGRLEWERREDLMDGWIMARSLQKREKKKSTRRDSSRMKRKEGDRCFELEINTSAAIARQCIE